MAILAFPVNIQTLRIQQQAGVNIFYPQIIGLANIEAQQMMNKTITQTVQSLFQQQFNQQGARRFAQMIGTYEVKTNQRHILSLTFSNYAIMPNAANGVTLMKSLTFDLRTGKTIPLAELFMPNTAYRRELNKIIEAQIKARNIPTIEPFPGVSANQDYYIADKCLVIYFPEIVFTPHYVGLPVFPISVFQLQTIVQEDGALGRMAAATG